MIPALIAIGLGVLFMALRWHADDEDERREATGRPTPWARQIPQVGLAALLFVVGVVVIVLLHFPWL